MAAHRHITGGRTSARRCLVLGLLLTSGFIARADDSRDASSREPQVTVREEQGVYSVNARFVVPEAPAVVLTVLTDYEQIPRFMPNVKSSIVRERSADRIIVEQEAEARMMMFSKRVYLRLEVRTNDDTVQFRDGSGRSFTKYEGAWRVAPEAGRTTVHYQLSAVPSFDVPSFVLTRLLKRDARQMIDRLRTEIAARAGQVRLKPDITSEGL